jgi:hypothetical protein
MGFFSGRVGFTRYHVAGRPVRSFGPDHLEHLAAHAIGKQRIASADGSEAGWGAGGEELWSEGLTMARFCGSKARKRVIFWPFRKTTQTTGTLRTWVHRPVDRR